jgi:ribosome-binding protein aMBF1 (putative translation factor)
MITQMKVEREMRGLSKSALSIKAGINYAVICQIENGSRKPYPKAAREVAEALDWQGDPMELFEESGETR